jgi:hypothetical protein
MKLVAEVGKGPAWRSVLFQERVGGRHTGAEMQETPAGFCSLPLHATVDRTMSPRDWVKVTRFSPISRGAITGFQNLPFLQVVGPIEPLPLEARE